MVLRKSDIFFLAVLLQAAALAVLFLHGGSEAGRRAPFLAEERGIVEALGLTDLCLFTDARYTRNPAVADRATPFQDGPLTMDHFPSASIVPPPPHLRAGP